MKLSGGIPVQEPVSEEEYIKQEQKRMEAQPRNLRIREVKGGWIFVNENYGYMQGSNEEIFTSIEAVTERVRIALSRENATA